jgi:hypothetical protein
MAHLLLGHLVVHFGCVRIRCAQRVREGAIDAVILVLIGDRERENLLLAEFRKAFHVCPRFNRSALPKLY